MWIWQSRIRLAPFLVLLPPCFKIFGKRTKELVILREHIYFEPKQWSFHEDNLIIKQVQCFFYSVQFYTYFHPIAQFFFPLLVCTPNILTLTLATHPSFHLCHVCSGELNHFCSPPLHLLYKLILVG